jgi:hypothetical protein
MFQPKTEINPLLSVVSAGAWGNEGIRPPAPFIFKQRHYRITYLGLALVVAAQVIAKYTDQEEDAAPVVFYSLGDKAKISVG